MSGAGALSFTTERIAERAVLVALTERDRLVVDDDGVRSAIELGSLYATPRGPLTAQRIGDWAVLDDDIAGVPLDDLRERSRALRAAFDCALAVAVGRALLYVEARDLRTVRVTFGGLVVASGDGGARGVARARWVAQRTLTLLGVRDEARGWRHAEPERALAVDQREQVVRAGDLIFVPEARAPMRRRPRRRRRRPR